MVGRKKKLKLCDKVSHEEDRISKLPDSLISEILSHLSTKDAVTTSVLSTKWRNLWQWVPALDLSRYSFQNFDAFVSFVHRVLDSHRKSWLRKLRLHIDDFSLFFLNRNDDFSHAKLFITRWIDAVTTPRIQHLDVKSFHAYEIPLSLYTCEALVHLQLFRAAFVVNAEFVSLPCLKILHLDAVEVPNMELLQKLISGSPVLEDLKIISQSTDDGNVLQVCSQTVKKISINMSTKVLIDAPLLVHLLLYSATLAYAEYVSLPCLKIMHLISVKDPSETTLQKLISGSPVLEDLRIDGYLTYYVKVLQIFSQTVKRILISLPTKVVIDAPLLVHLQLYNATLAYAEFVSLPCLKIMHLENVKDPSETMLQKLISGSPVLEDLTIIDYSTDNAKVLLIFSQTVKRIQINLPTKAVIDAPLLQYLWIVVSSTNNVEIINLGISIKLDIFSYDEETFSSNVIHDLLANISRVRDLVITNHYWKDIFLYSKSGPVLQFGDLSRLEAGISKSDLEMLPTILESCPKLESFILDISMPHKKKKEPKVMFSTVPQCLVSSLKFVELKWSKTTRYEGEKELVRYLLKNATILQTLKLGIYYPEKAKCGFLQELLAMPRCSSSCEIHCSFKWEC